MGNSNYNLDGTDVDNGVMYVTKSYLMEVYPNLVPWMRTAGIWLWGRNTYGQVGDNTLIAKSSPVQTVAGGQTWQQCSAGGYHTASVKTDGRLWLWGRNDSGQLGDTTNVTQSSPVQTIAGGSNWKQAACGYTHSMAIKTDGTLWTWGANAYGQLGDNSSTVKSSPVQTIAGGTTWKYASAGSYHSAAIKTDSTLWLWGENNIGQLGNNAVANKSSPVQTVAGGTNWKSVAGGGLHTAAIQNDGTLWVWGSNNQGQLGDNTLTNRSSPVQTVAGGTNWKQISCGNSHTAAIKTDGTLWLWGFNAYGQLGDNTITKKSSPVQTVAGGTTWKYVACGFHHTVAIKTDGTLWTWGFNSAGQLGDNSTTDKSSPIQTVAGGNNWKAIGLNHGHSTVAIRSVDDNI